MLYRIDRGEKWPFKIGILTALMIVDVAIYVVGVRLDDSGLLLCVMGLSFGIAFSLITIIHTIGCKRDNRKEEIEIIAMVASVFFFIYAILSMRWV